MAQSDPPGSQQPAPYKKLPVNTSEPNAIRAPVHRQTLPLLPQSGIKRPYASSVSRPFLSSDDGRSVTSGGFSSEAPSTSSSKRRCAACKIQTPFDAHQLLCCAICKRSYHRRCCNTRVDTDPWRCGNCAAKVDKQTRQANRLQPGTSQSSTPTSWSPSLPSLSPSNVSSPRRSAQNAQKEPKALQSETNHRSPVAAHAPYALSTNAMPVSDSTTSNKPRLDRGIPGETEDARPSMQLIIPPVASSEKSPTVPVPVARMAPLALGVKTSESNVGHSRIRQQATTSRHESPKDSDETIRRIPPQAELTQTTRGVNAELKAQAAVIDAPITTCIASVGSPVSASVLNGLSDTTKPQFDTHIAGLGSFTSASAEPQNQHHVSGTSDPPAQELRKQKGAHRSRAESELIDHILVQEDETIPNKDPRPNYSYRELAEAALLDAPGHRLQAWQVVKWVYSNVAGYSSQDQDLKAGISSVLSATARKATGSIISEEPKTGDTKQTKWWLLRPSSKHLIRPWDKKKKSLGTPSGVSIATVSPVGSQVKGPTHKDASGGSTRRQGRRKTGNLLLERPTGGVKSSTRHTSNRGTSAPKQNLGPSLLKESARNTEPKRRNPSPTAERPAKRRHLDDPSGIVHGEAVDGNESEAAASGQLPHQPFASQTRGTLAQEVQGGGAIHSEGSRSSISAKATPNRIMGTFVIDDDDSEGESVQRPVLPRIVAESRTEDILVIQTTDLAMVQDPQRLNMSEDQATWELVQDSYADDTGTVLELPDLTQDEPTTTGNAVQGSDEPNGEASLQIHEPTIAAEPPSAVASSHENALPLQPDELPHDHVPVEPPEPPIEQIDVDMILDSVTPPSVHDEPNTQPNQISAARIEHNARVLAAIRNRQRQLFPTLSQIQLPKRLKPVPLMEIEARPTRKRLMRAGPEWSRLGHNTALERMEIVNTSIQRAAPPKGPLNAPANDGMADIDAEGADYGFGMGYGNLTSSQEPEEYDNLDDLLGVPAKVEFKVQDGHLVVVDAGATSRGARGRLSRVKNVYRTGYANKAR